MGLRPSVVDGFPLAVSLVRRMSITTSIRVRGVDFCPDVSCLPLVGCGVRSGWWKFRGFRRSSHCSRYVCLFDLSARILAWISSQISGECHHGLPIGFDANESPIERCDVLVKPKGRDQSYNPLLVVPGEAAMICEQSHRDMVQVINVERNLERDQNITNLIIGVGDFPVSKTCHQGLCGNCDSLRCPQKTDEKT